MWQMDGKKVAHKEIARNVKGYMRANCLFDRIWKKKNSAELDILSKILDKDNLNRAYKRVKANKGAPVIDEMTIDS